MLVVNRLSIQSKLMLILLSVSLGSVVVIAFIGYTNAREAMNHSARNQLQGMRIAKTSLIKELLVNTRNEVVSLSDNRAVIEGMREFRKAYRELETAKSDPAWDTKIHEFYNQEFLPELAKRVGGQPTLETYVPTSLAARYLQYHYIAANPYAYEKKQGLEDAGDGSLYSAVHRQYHASLSKTAALFGFADIVLVDADTLDVVYTYQKTTEFGTNLRSGPYANTNLGMIVRTLQKAQDRDVYKFADFEPYRPNLGQPMAFCGSPIFDGAQMIGIILFQFPIDGIVRVMTGNFNWKQEGLGKTGEVYLVGPDFTMRSRSRFMVENKENFLQTLKEQGLAAHVISQIARQANVLLTLPVKTLAAERAMRGEEGVDVILNYRHKPVLSAYGPVELDSLRWAVIAEIDVAEAYESANVFGRKVLTITVLVVMVVSILSMVLSHFFVLPIRRLTDAARKISTGALDVEVQVNTRDEFRELVDAFNSMIRSLKAKTIQLEQKVRENEELLLNIMPAPVALRLREGDGQTPQSFADVTVLFADLIGFEHVSETIGADRSMALLQDLVVAFDETAERIGVEKVKTVGSSYLAVCGLSVERPDHLNRMIEFAQELVRVVQRFNLERGTTLVVEIGINAGPVVGGIVGRKKFIYDLWGDTVTIARGLKVNGVTSIQVTGTVQERMQGLYHFEKLGDVEIRGKGRIPTWTLKS